MVTYNFFFLFHAFISWLLYISIMHVFHSMPSPSFLCHGIEHTQTLRVPISLVTVSGLHHASTDHYLWKDACLPFSLMYYLHCGSLCVRIKTQRFKQKKLSLCLAYSFISTFLISYKVPQKKKNKL